MVRASNHDHCISGWRFCRWYGGRRQPQGRTQGMNLYIKTLDKLFETLPSIADSEAIKGHDKARAEIMTAYEHLDKAMTRLVIDNV